MWNFANVQVFQIFLHFSQYIFQMLMESDIDKLSLKRRIGLGNFRVQLDKQESDDLFGRGCEDRDVRLIINAPSAGRPSYCIAAGRLVCVVETLLRSAHVYSAHIRHHWNFRCDHESIAETWQCSRSYYIYTTTILVLTVFAEVSTGNR